MLRQPEPWMAKYSRLWLLGLQVFRCSVTNCFSAIQNRTIWHFPQQNHRSALQFSHCVSQRNNFNDFLFCWFSCFFLFLFAACPELGCLFGFALWPAPNTLSLQRPWYWPSLKAGIEFDFFLLTFKALLVWKVPPSPRGKFGLFIGKPKNIQCLATKRLVMSQNYRPFFNAHQKCSIFFLSENVQLP